MDAFFSSSVIEVSGRGQFQYRARARRCVAFDSCGSLVGSAFFGKFSKESLAAAKI